MNLDNADRSGTHWVAYAKRGDCALIVSIFDHRRNWCDIWMQIDYNRTPYQRYNQSNYGQLSTDTDFLQIVDNQFKN